MITVHHWASRMILRTGQHRNIQLAIWYHGYDNTTLLGQEYCITDMITLHCWPSSVILQTEHCTVGLVVWYNRQDYTALLSYVLMLFLLLAKFWHHTDRQNLHAKAVCLCPQFMIWLRSTKFKDIYIIVLSAFNEKWIPATRTINVTL
jgi:hypothetical protein